MIRSRPTAILVPSRARVAIALGVVLCGPALGPVEGAFREGGGRAALGPVAIQLAPFCNVLTLTAAPLGPVFLLTGSDDACGGEPAPVTGSAVVRTDGQVALGLTLAGAAGANEIAGTVDPTALTGTWRDSGGRSGSLAPAPAPPAPGQPRPTDLPPLEATVARAAGYLLQCPGTCGVSVTLPVPVGRRLTSVEMDVCDSSPSGFAHLEVRRVVGFPVTEVVVATGETTGTPGCGAVAASLATPEVVAAGTAYRARVTLDLGADPGVPLVLHGIRTIYTIEH